MLSHGQTVHFRPHSVIHHQKAMLPRIKMSYLEPILVHPVRRQIFCDTSAMIFFTILKLRHMLRRGCLHQNIKINLRSFWKSEPTSCYMHPWMFLKTRLKISNIGDHSLSFFSFYPSLSIIISSIIIF